MTLDITPLERAVARLEEGWARYQQDRTDLQVRDGLVQRFEFTYEIAHRLLKRDLEASSANPEAFDSMSFQELIRTGFERGLLRGSWPEWRRYREIRAKTSLTYDEDVTLEVVSGIPAFMEEARLLRDALRGRQASA